MSYLSSRDELQGSQRGLHVRDIRLEIIECVRDAGLELRRLLPRCARRCNLVEGSHCCDRGAVTVLGLRFWLDS